MRGMGAGPGALVLLTGVAWGPGLGAQQTPPVLDPGARAGPRWFLETSVSSVFDTNIHRSQDPLDDHGLVAGLGVGFQDDPRRPSFQAFYDVGLHSYSATDQWDRLSQQLRASYRARPRSWLNLEAAGQGSLKGSTEDRDLADVFVFQPRAELRLTRVHRVRFTAAHRVKRATDEEGTQAWKPYAGVEYRLRPSSGPSLDLGARFDVNRTEDPRGNYERWTYEAEMSGPLGRGGFLSVGVRRRQRVYPERMVRDLDEPRRDVRWIPSLSASNPLGRGMEAALEYAFERRTSNDVRKEYQGHVVMLTLRHSTSPGSRLTPQAPVGLEPGRGPAAGEMLLPAGGARPPGMRVSFRDVDAGAAHTCAVSSDGAVFCWGANRGQLGDGSWTPSPVPLRVADSLRVVTLSTGHQHTCALTEGGDVFCWGGPDRMLPRGGTWVAHAPVPRRVDAGRRFRSVTSGYRHTCALDAEGRAYCWGSNPQGALGDGSLQGSADPVPVAGDLVFASISAGGGHTCAVTPEGEAFCWGSNEDGQLGNPTYTSFEKPLPVEGNLRFSSVSSGVRHTCGITLDSGAYCWGANEKGQLGDGSLERRWEPVPVGGGRPFTDVRAGWAHTCGLTPSGSAYCWGLNQAGELGIGTADSTPHPLPEAVTGGFRFKGLRVSSHTCGTLQNGEVHCWGGNESGQLGTGATRAVSAPAPVRSPAEVTGRRSPTP